MEPVSCFHRLRRSTWRALYAASIFFWASFPAIAQDQTDQHQNESTEFEAIDVIGLKNPDRLAPEQLRAAYAVFQKGKPIFAPGAALYFTVSGESAIGGGNRLRLRLVDVRTDETISVPIDAGGRFALPELDYASRKFELQANRKAGSLGLDVAVFSPGTDATHRLLGDLRLQCRVWWSFARHKVPFFAKAVFGGVKGPCNARKVALFTDVPRPIVSAVVKTSVEVIPVKVVTSRRRYRAPIYDQKIPNSALIIIEY